MPALKCEKRTVGIVVGAAFLAAGILLPPPEGMPPQAWRIAGVALLMATWWITEILPVPATALLPLVLLPLLGVASIKQAAAPFADPIVFLFLGGFILGSATQRWMLHKRIGLQVIAWVGTSPTRLVGGIMLATAFLSMWVSNTATAIMMLPVAISVLTLYDRDIGIDEQSRSNLGVALLLAVAYGASIGGIGTLIGTPPNALLAGYMAREHGVQIGFAQWMALGVPLAAIMLAATWLVLMRIHPVAEPLVVDLKQVLNKELRDLGPVTPAQIRVICVLVVTATAWVCRPLLSVYVPGLHDGVIAVAAAISLFLLPAGMPGAGRLLIWDDLKTLPWGVLLLFGGGLSLAAAIEASGLAAWFGSVMAALGSWPVVLIAAAATIGMIFLTELTSNTASAATFLPFGGAVAVGLGIDPLLLAVPLALAASCAFMLPVATPPNAIVYASGRLTIAQMAWTGFWLNLVSTVCIVALSYSLVCLLFGE